MSSKLKFLLTLRYYASGSMLVVLRDFIGVHKSTASRIVEHVSHVLDNLRPEFIKFPENDDIIEVKQNFHNISKFPMVIGALDFTHIKIKSPCRDISGAYRNRKDFFINVQTICVAYLKIQDIVARWPESVHNSTIFNNSAIRGKLERAEMEKFLIGG